MTKERFEELLKGGFSAKTLAYKLGTSEGHLNELRRMPNAELIAQTFNLDVEKVKEVLSQPNLSAIYEFGIKKNVELTEEDLQEAIQAKKRESKKVEIAVGLETSIGVISEIKKIGKTIVYIIKKADGTLDYVGSKGLQEALKNKNNE